MRAAGIGITAPPFDQGNFIQGRAFMRQIVEEMPCPRAALNPKVFITIILGDLIIPCVKISADIQRVLAKLILRFCNRAFGKQIQQQGGKTALALLGPTTRLRRKAGAC